MSNVPLLKHARVVVVGGGVIVPSPITSPIWDGKILFF